MRRFFLKSILLGTAIVAVTPLLVPVPIGHSAASADQGHPDFEAIFGGNCRCLQIADRFGTVSRSAFDESGRRIGIQVGTYNPGEPNKIAIEMTYLEPDAEHPHGRAFDVAGNPTPLH